MSLKDRFLNVAKAEIIEAARKVKGGVDGLLGSDEDLDAQERRLDEEIRRYEEEERAARANAQARASARLTDEELNRYYANLELPIGASADEVKAAYRRLMRRYHPDRHHLDPSKAEVAGEIAQQLRTAYEALVAHLGSKA